MGTSSSNKGNSGKGTPLVPSWLEEGENGSAPTGSGGANEGERPLQSSPLPPPADPRRYITARNNFSRYISSGGKDRASLGRAISSYIARSSGGPRKAAQSMGAARKVGAGLLSFLSDTTEHGSREVLRSLNLETLAGLPFEDVLIGLIDHICPEGDTEDAGIARDAFTDTIAELVALEITDLDSLTPDQIQVIFVMYMTNAIEKKVYNEIGTKVVALPSSPDDVLRVQEQVRDFIHNAVSDSVTASQQAFENITSDRVEKFVNSVFEQAFTILLELSNRESS